MKRQFLIFASLFLLSASAIFSQTTEAQVSKIRAIYAEINKRIEAGLKENTEGYHYAVWTVGGKGDGMQWSAVGNMETRDEIWFSGGDPGAGDEEEGRVEIHKIVWNYKAAGDLRSRTEYYFDETGEPIFVYASSNTESNDDKMIERRFYYSKGKLLRVTSGGKNTDANFSAEDLEKSRDEIEGAKQMHKRYAAMLSE